ncbi:MAG: hypothetical protein ACRDZQ_04140 [Acidimicrobiales bacterium]
MGIPGPHVALAASPSQPAGVSELRFADPLDGWAFGPALWATHDGGSRWQPVSLPGAGAGTKVLDLAAAGGRVYALAIDLGPGPGSGRARLYSSPAHGDAWAPVSGVEASTYGGGTIILHGHSAWVLVDPGLSGAHFWRSSGGHALAATPPPCPGVGGRRPFVAAASSSDLVAACGSQAGTGQEAKTVYTSTDGGQTFAAAGDAPREGDLEGVAASPSAIVVAAASGASELYASFDGGRTWQTVVSDTASGGQPWHDLGFTSATQGIVIEGSPPAARPGAGSGAGSAGSRPSRLLETTDGGRTWETVTFSR